MMRIGQCWRLFYDASLTLFKAIQRTPILYHLQCIIRNTQTIHALLCSVLVWRKLVSTISRRIIYWHWYTALIPVMWLEEYETWIYFIGYINIHWSRISVMASQITDNLTICSAVNSNSVSLSLCERNHRFPYKGPIKWKVLLCHDVIMCLWHATTLWWNKLNV